MAFQDHVSHEMAFQSPLSASASSSASAGPAWLSNAVLRLNDDGLGRSRSEKGGHNNNNNGGEDELIDGSGAGGDNWERAKCKAEILGHPLYEQLLAAHVACLRIATPVDQLARIDTQLAQSQQVVAKTNNSFVSNPCSSSLYVNEIVGDEDQLQQHVRVHAMEAVMACWELEQSLQSLTGASLGEGTGATMSDDDDDQADSDTNLYDGGLDGADCMGFGPLVPTESERSLMEHVRKELKHELKQEEDKARLVQETGLQLKQINNWFINQRKRNWHSNPSGSTTKSKRKK
ncbi:hypothetical protein GH714_013324 [Hevea brasiliensis]|uniref:Homeobox domain-containing protein n=1 Tax=Hevea brasiliensis TaxID=3981 RepID=A0A6A6M9U2_HEVBR|nr:hypothetical protein GH714_013324 [Hevea brasiliensis]